MNDDIEGPIFGDVLILLELLSNSFKNGNTKTPRIYLRQLGPFPPQRNVFVRVIANPRKFFGQTFAVCHEFRGLQDMCFFSKLIKILHAKLAHVTSD